MVILYGRQHSFKIFYHTAKLIYASFFIFGIAPKTKQKTPSFILTLVLHYYHDMFVFPAKKRECLEVVSYYV